MSAPHFEYLNSINTGNDDIMVTESTYSGFMVNRGLSYFPDTIFYANEMNINFDLDNRLQYDFLRHAIRKRKRFSKWFKASKNDDFEAVKAYYKYNDRNTRLAMRILRPEQVKEIKEKMKMGGRK